MARRLQRWLDPPPPSAPPPVAPSAQPSTDGETPPRSPGEASDAPSRTPSTAATSAQTAAAVPAWESPRKSAGAGWARRGVAHHHAAAHHAPAPRDVHDAGAAGPSRSEGSVDGGADGETTLAAEAAKAAAAAAQAAAVAAAAAEAAAKAKAAAAARRAEGMRRALGLGWAGAHRVLLFAGLTVIKALDSWRDVKICIRHLESFKGLSGHSSCQGLSHEMFWLPQAVLLSELLSHLFFLSYAQSRMHLSHFLHAIFEIYHYNLCCEFDF